MMPLSSILNNETQWILNKAWQVEFSYSLFSLTNKKWKVLIDLNHMKLGWMLHLKMLMELFCIYSIYSKLLLKYFGHFQAPTEASILSILTFFSPFDLLKITY